MTPVLSSTPMSILVVLSLGFGSWFPYHAWRDIVPDIWDPGGKLEVGRRLRHSTSFIFGLGGVMRTAEGHAALAQAAKMAH